LKSRAQGSEQRAQQQQGGSLRFPARVLLTCVLALVTAGASAWLVAGTGAIHCDSLAPLTVLATLAAFIISICFGQISRYPHRGARWLLFGCLLLAGATLFTDFRFVRRYRGFCNQLRQQIRPTPPGANAAP
jgi:hypothetical protein